MSRARSGNHDRADSSANQASHHQRCKQRYPTLKKTNQPRITRLCLLLQLLDDIWLEIRRVVPTVEPLNNLTITTDEKLLKVPLDHLQAHEARLLGLHPLPDGLGVCAIDRRLGEDGERDALVAGAESLDGVVLAGLLARELVAWKADHFELVGVL